MTCLGPRLVDANNGPHWTHGSIGNVLMSIYEHAFISLVGCCEASHGSSSSLPWRSGMGGSPFFILGTAAYTAQSPDSRN